MLCKRIRKIKKNNKNLKKKKQLIMKNLLYRSKSKFKRTTNDKYCFFRKIMRRPGFVFIFHYL